MRWDVLSYSDMINSATPWTVARQAPLSMAFSRQEHWSGLLFPPPDLPNPGIKPRSPALQADSLPCDPPGKPLKKKDSFLNMIFLQVSHPFLLCWALWVYSCSPWSALTFILRAEALSAHEPRARTGWICMDWESQGQSCLDSGRWTVHLCSEKQSVASGYFFFSWSKVSGLRL